MSIITSPWMIVQLTIATCSVLAGLLTLFTIYDIGHPSGFLMLVASLSSAQLLYDLGFFFSIESDGDEHDSLYVVCNFNKIFFQMFGGVATTLITNSIAFIVASIAFSLRSYDIKQKFRHIMFWVFVIAFVPAITSAILFAQDPDLNRAFTIIYRVYSAMRIASILVNIVLCALLTVKLNSMGLYLFVGSDNANPIHPVAALSSRMILYPIVQVITRVGAAWMEFGIPIKDADEESSDYQTAFALFSLFSPAAGVGFFLIFISMQPIARKHLYDRFLRLCYSGEANDTDDQGQMDIKIRLLGNSVVHEEGVAETMGKSEARVDTSPQMERQNSSNPLNIPSRALPIPSRSSRTSREYQTRLLVSSQGSSMAISRSHSGNLDPAFLPQTLNTLDDDELGLLVDRLAEEQSNSLHDSGYSSSISADNSGRAVGGRGEEELETGT